MSLFREIIDSLSLSGAVILFLVGLTVYGMASHNDEAWKMFGTALTTFVSGKGMAMYELNQKAKKEQQNGSEENNNQ